MVFVDWLFILIGGAFGGLLVVGIVAGLKHYLGRRRHWNEGSNFEAVENMDGEISALTLNVEGAENGLSVLEGFVHKRGTDLKRSLGPVDFIFLQEAPRDAFKLETFFGRLKRRGVPYNWDSQAGLVLASIYPIENADYFEREFGIFQTAAVEIPSYGRVRLVNVRLRGDLKAGARAAVEYAEELASRDIGRGLTVKLEILGGHFGFHTGIPRPTLRPAPSNKYLEIVNAGFRDVWPAGVLDAWTYAPLQGKPSRLSYFFTRGAPHWSTAKVAIPAGAVSDHGALIAALKILGGRYGD